MGIHEIFFSDLYDHLIMELDVINDSTKDTFILIELCIDAVRRTIMVLKEEVLKSGFASDLDEIHFFKVVKPRFYSLLVYYGKVLEVELKRPTGSREIVTGYFKKEASKLYYFYEKHRDFYQYYRVGSTYLDNKYFLRKSDNIISSVGIYGIDTDAMFTTGQDFIVSKIEAHERLSGYIEEALHQLQQGTGKMEDHNGLSMELAWTASKASLIELLYGLHSAGTFNNGTVGIQQVAAFFEKSFHVQLGNYYRAFQEIRIRKKNRTQFLDEVKRKLVDKMDFLDENPKY